MKHVHADVIHAWADGETIEKMDCGQWCELTAKMPCWHADVQYRVKPEKVYPVTGMTRADLPDVYLPHEFEKGGAKSRHSNVESLTPRCATPSTPGK